MAKERQHLWSWLLLRYCQGSNLRHHAGRLAALGKERIKPTAASPWVYPHERRAPSLPRATRQQ